MEQEQDQDRINKAKIPDAILALKELKPKELPDVSAKEAIRQMRRYIEGALKKNYTYDEISSLLAGLDIHISGSRLKYLLGEIRKSTRPRKKKKVDSAEETAVDSAESITVNQGATESQELTGSESENISFKKSHQAQVKPKTQSQSDLDSKKQGELHTFKPRLYSDSEL